MDKIGEVIGPKGKVINAIQQETGADITVDDDGIVGTVTIGSPDGRKVAEAGRQIELILNPPTAEVGEVYTGRVVNITKFGAFVNILPGRDGLVHISKLGGGKRIDRVEDVRRPRRRDRGAGRRHRPERQGQPHARSATTPMPAAAAATPAERPSGERSPARRRSTRGDRRPSCVRGRLRRRGPRGVRRPRPDRRAAGGRAAGDRRGSDRGGGDRAGRPPPATTRSPA